MRRGTGNNLRRFLYRIAAASLRTADGGPEWSRRGSVA